jgi:flavin-binding protein dodecin
LQSPYHNLDPAVGTDSRGLELFAALPWAEIRDLDHRWYLRTFSPGDPMPDHVYKSIELVGSSSRGMEDAVQKAIAKAAETVRNLRWFEVLDTRGHIENGKVVHWQVTLKIGFTLDE